MQDMQLSASHSNGSDQTRATKKAIWSRGLLDQLIPSAEPTPAGGIYCYWSCSDQGRRHPVSLCARTYRLWATTKRRRERMNNVMIRRQAVHRRLCATLILVLKGQERTMRKKSVSTSHDEDIWTYYRSWSTQLRLKLVLCFYTSLKHRRPFGLFHDRLRYIMHLQTACSNIFALASPQHDPRQ